MIFAVPHMCSKGKGKGKKGKGRVSCGPSTDDSLPISPIPNLDSIQVSDDDFETKQSDSEKWTLTLSKEAKESLLRQLHLPKSCFHSTNEFDKKPCPVGCPTRAKDIVYFMHRRRRKRNLEEFDPIASLVPS